MEQEQIQKKTFTNWVNAQLAKVSRVSELWPLIDLTEATLFEIEEIEAASSMLAVLHKGIKKISSKDL